LIRRFNAAITEFARQNRGREDSGSFHTIALGQKMLARDSVLLGHETIEIRFVFSLPTKGSRGGSLILSKHGSCFLRNYRVLLTTVCFTKIMMKLQNNG
jgi:hypothetical protein